MDDRFEAWLRQVDHFVQGATGLSYQDLPDVAYRDWFEDGVTARSAAKRVVREAMFT